jgi:hypothetical protein
MRLVLAALALLASCAGHAAIVNIPAETGASVDEDDWSIPLHRCIRSTDGGVGVYDGAERCAIAFAFPLDVGRRIIQVRALYGDDDLGYQLSMRLMSRDVIGATNSQIAAAADNSPHQSAIQTMSLFPNHLIMASGAPSLIVELGGDTRLKAITYEYK